ncbi:MAG TPA: fructose-bisphosphatase class II [Leptospiraceae bacterium]|nr:fructose-bisphosphatase class II [Leptospiraceae bacterium]HMW03554.1 fructose-bisphosphatase class II [Leptospiraceae bacterium]HMX35016.1 fructose-bisphosphatase class II [Leptospiraceae bacterium]HMY29525.1 fructose-bisphosphatase class II [Leptospiraceae bacterium]HNA10188.1 fructose-bisphosphatase class II [Leptospiraceae bacterium]
MKIKNCDELDSIHLNKIMNLNAEYILNTLANITEKTAQKTFPLFGKMDKKKADHIAVEEMRFLLGQLPFQSRVIIGEGEKDEAPMLYEDEILGGSEFQIDIAVDPLECTTNFAKGLPNSMCVIAFTERDGLHRVPGTYMEQWVAPPQMKYPFEPKENIKANLEKLSDSLHKNISDLIIVVQDRPRHKELIESIRSLGCGISLIESGSLTCIMDICLGKGNYDALIGTYGAPEGLIGAVIAKATGSEFKGIIRAHEEKHREKWIATGREEEEILDKNDLVPANVFGFVATGIAENSILKGIHKVEGKITGESILISKNINKIRKFKED